MPTAEIGDLIEFVHPWSGLCLWGVYVGEGHVMPFEVGGKCAVINKTAYAGLSQCSCEKHKEPGLIY